MILALKVGFWILLIGLPALLLAYLYTGSRYALSTMGTADVFVLTYFGVIPVWATVYILSGVNSADAVLVGLQLGFFANALLLINNLRDVEEDSEHNKKTLVVRFGRRFGISFLAVCLISPYMISFFLDPIFFRVRLWTTPIVLLSLVILFKVASNKPSQRYNKYLGFTALSLLFFTLFSTVGILSS